MEGPLVVLSNSCQQQLETCWTKDSLFMQHAYSIPHNTEHLQLVTADYFGCYVNHESKHSLATCNKYLIFFLVLLT